MAYLTQKGSYTTTITREINDESKYSNDFVKRNIIKKNTIKSQINRKKGTSNKHKLIEPENKNIYKDTPWPKLKYNGKQFECLLPVITNKETLNEWNNVIYNIDALILKYKPLFFKIDCKSKSIVNIATVLKYNELMNRIGGEKLCHKMSTYITKLFINLLQKLFNSCKNNKKYKFFRKFVELTEPKSSTIMKIMDKKPQILPALKFKTKFDMDYDKYCSPKYIHKYRYKCRSELSKVLNIDPSCIKMGKTVKGSIWQDWKLPISGAIVGAILGGTVGLLVGGPVGCVAGSIAGLTLGGITGEILRKCLHDKKGNGIGIISSIKSLSQSENSTIKMDDRILWTKSVNIDRLKDIKWIVGYYLKIYDKKRNQVRVAQIKTNVQYFRYEIEYCDNGKKQHIMKTDNFLKNVVDLGQIAVSQCFSDSL